MTESMDNRDDFLAAIERHGEEYVKARIKAGLWSAKHRKWASDWLAEQERKRGG
jgi:hypothetical protein